MDVDTVCTALPTFDYSISLPQGTRDDKPPSQELFN